MAASRASGSGFGRWSGRGCTAFPTALTAMANPDYQAFIANQQAQFAVKRKSLSELQASRVKSHYLSRFGLLGSLRMLWSRWSTP